MNFKLYLKTIVVQEEEKCHNCEKNLNRHLVMKKHIKNVIAFECVCEQNIAYYTKKEEEGGFITYELVFANKGIHLLFSKHHELISSDEYPKREQTKPGSITTTCGPMRSNKTTASILKAQSEILSGKSVYYMRLSLRSYNTRSDVPHVDSRNMQLMKEEYGDQLQIDVIGKSGDISVEQCLEFDTIIIDEAHFYVNTESLVSILHELADSGKHVFIYGVDMDWERKPFRTSSACMGISDNVVKMRAVDRVTGNPSVFTYKIGGNTNQLQSGDDLYISVDREHYLLLEKEDFSTIEINKTT